MKRGYDAIQPSPTSSPDAETCLKSPIKIKKLQKTAERKERSPANDAVATDGAKRKRGQRRWTEEQKMAQAERMKALKPWQKTRGPVTEAGKKRASRNAVKHGMESAQTKKLKRLLKLQRAYMRKAKELYHKIALERRDAYKCLPKPQEEH